MGRRGTREITRLALLYTNHCRSSEVALTPYLERHRRNFFCVRAGIPLVTPEEAARGKKSRVRSRFVEQPPPPPPPPPPNRSRGIKTRARTWFYLGVWKWKGEKRPPLPCYPPPSPFSPHLTKFHHLLPSPSLVISRSPRRSQREIEREREREAKSARGGQ